MQYDVGLLGDADLEAAAWRSFLHVNTASAPFYRLRLRVLVWCLSTSASVSLVTLHGGLAGQGTAWQGRADTDPAYIAGNFCRSTDEVLVGATGGVSSLPYLENQGNGTVCAILRSGLIAINLTLFSGRRVALGSRVWEEPR